MSPKRRPLPGEFERFVADAERYAAILLTDATLPGASAEPSLVGMTREEMDAKLEAVEARNEARYIDLQHKIGGLTAAITGDRGVLAEMTAMKADNKATRWTVIGTGIAVIGALIGILAFGGDQFGSGKELGASLSALETKIDQLQTGRTPSSPQAPVVAPTKP
jgi:hypothetical protein